MNGGKSTQLSGITGNEKERITRNEKEIRALTNQSDSAEKTIGENRWFPKPDGSQEICIQELELNQYGYRKNVRYDFIGG